MRSIDFEVVIPQEFFRFVRDSARALIAGRPASARASFESYDHFVAGIEEAPDSSYTLVVPFDDIHFFLNFLHHLMRRPSPPKGFNGWVTTMYEGAKAHRQMSIVDLIGEIE